MDKKDICLYIGYAVNRDLEKTIKGISVAGNKMQNNLLRELCVRLDEEICPISIYPIASYPTGERLYIREHEEQLFSYRKNDKESFLITKVPRIINLPIIKNLFEIISTYYVAKRVAKQGKLKYIILFNCFPPTAYTALKLKKKFGCEIISLLADLPIDDSVKTRGLNSLLRYVFDWFTRESIKKLDKVIVLNKTAADLFAPNVPFIVMEGAVNKVEVSQFKYIIPPKKNVVFTGSLQKHNGIVEVVEAFKLLRDEDVELEVYGNGEYREFVIEASKQFPKIRYCGIKNNTEIIQIQKEAYLLVNPRPVDNYISQVTFPSKMFEYMTSGTPVLATKLNGYSQEMLNSLYVIEEDTPNGIAQAILRVINKQDDELKQKALSAYNLIVNRYNWEAQTNRIVNFIKECK